MKAAQIIGPGGLDRVQIAARDEPSPPRPSEVCVRIHACALNYHDYRVATGAIRVSEPRVLLSDAAGEVVSIGDGVTAFAPGDRVISTYFPHWLDGLRPEDGLASIPGDGQDGYAREWVTVPAHFFTRAPLGVSAAEAATLPCAALTAWRALFAEGSLQEADTVLVMGTGGVSIFALQFAKAIGAHVIATSSSDAKLKRLKALGADDVINYRETPDWGAMVRQLTRGRGADHVVEIGGVGTLRHSMEAARSGGSIWLIGSTLGGSDSGSPVMTMLIKQLRVAGITVGSHRHQHDMVAAIETYAIRPVIDSVFPLDQIADAFRHLESGAHFGKIVITL